MKLTWKDVYANPPHPIEGRVFKLNQELLDVLNAHMGTPEMSFGPLHCDRSVEDFERQRRAVLSGLEAQGPGLAQDWIYELWDIAERERNFAFFDQTMLGGRLELGNPGDGEFGIKTVSDEGKQQPLPIGFHLRVFNRFGLFEDIAGDCNFDPRTNDLVEPQCGEWEGARLSAYDEISRIMVGKPIRITSAIKDGASCFGGFYPIGGPDPTISQNLLVRGLILLAAFDELPLDPEGINGRFIMTHQDKITALRERINATQKALQK